MSHLHAEILGSMVYGIIGARGSERNKAKFRCPICLQVCRFESLAGGAPTVHVPEPSFKLPTSFI